MKNFLITVLFLCYAINQANASIILTPTRVEFDSKEKGQLRTVRISNNSEESKNYRISLQHLRMNKNGEYSVIKNNEKNIPEKFVDNIILYSPKRISLEAKSSQTIRLLLKNADNLSAGEYRSHLTIEEEKEVEKLPNKADDNRSKKSLTVSLKALLSISIPIIFNNGERTGKIEFGDSSVKQNNLNFTMLRQGNSSIYGDLYAEFIDSSKKHHEIALINAISVLYPYKERIFSIKIDPKKNLEIENGRVELVFYAREFVDGEFKVNKNNILAKKSFTID